MAITYGFYNSLNKDRVYNAEQMSSIFNGIITDGVFSTIGDALMPIAGTGMQVIVKTGKCWFNSTWTLNDALLPLDIEAADVSLTRIDAIIVEINSSIGTRANTIKMLKGTPSANPAKPTLANSEHLHQYALGYVTVSAGVTSITADKIEVNVGKATCPFITSVLQQTDITDLFNQWDAEFSAWFANVQSQLSGDIAANLQRQIDALNLSEKNHLKSETKEMYGLSVDATPDDAFKLLNDFYLGKIIYKEFTESQEWTPPSNFKKLLYVICAGGGGAGGAGCYGRPGTSSGDLIGGGGAGGNVRISNSIHISKNETVNIVVGAGGVASDTLNKSTAGGASSFGDYLTANGGGPGGDADIDVSNYEGVYNLASGGTNGCGGGGAGTGNQITNYKNGGAGGMYGGGGGGMYGGGGGGAGGMYGGGGGGKTRGANGDIPNAGIGFELLFLMLNAIRYSDRITHGIKKYKAITDEQLYGVGGYKSFGGTYTDKPSWPEYSGTGGGGFYGNGGNGSTSSSIGAGGGGGFFSDGKYGGGGGSYMSYGKGGDGGQAASVESKYTKKYGKGEDGGDGCVAIFYLEE